MTYEEMLDEATWRWRLKVLKQAKKRNKTNLELRYLQTNLIRNIEKDLEKYD